MTTINDILFGGAAQARRGLGGALRLVDAARRELSVSTHASGALASLFDMPVGNVLLDAWYGNRLVRTACANTLAQPGLREEVQLFTTTVTCSYRPTLDLDTAGRRLTVAQLELELELKLESLVLEVAGGRVTAVGPGIGTARGTLKAGSTVLADRRTDRVHIGRAVRLGGGPEPAVTALFGRPTAPAAHGLRARLWRRAHV